MNRFLLVLVSICMISFASCKKDDGSIYGKVVYAVKVQEDGSLVEKMKPAVGATVRIYKGYTNEGSASSGLTPIGTVKTDANGAYKFDDLSQGNYYLTAFADITDTFVPGQPAETVKMSNGAYNTIAVMLIEGQSVKKDITISKQ